VDDLAKRRLLFDIWADEEQENLDLFIRRNLFIRTKKGPIVRFRPNSIQQVYAAMKAKALAEGKPPRFLVLKYRRGGISTWEQAESFHRICTKEGQHAVTLAHETDSTETIFEISTLFYERMDPLRRPKRKTKNKRELNFPSLRSKFYIGTAGQVGFGRGATIQKVHGSEVAKWPGGIRGVKDLMAGLTEAATDGEVVLESTANGMGNWFQMTFYEATKGANNWTPIFLAWYMDPTNRIPLEPGERITPTDKEKVVVEAYGLDAEQLKWRRAKIKELGDLFPQEYPEDWVTAFMVTGHLWFSQTILRDLLPLCGEPVDDMELMERGLDPDLIDGIEVWHPPAEDGKYFIGADCSEGIEGMDFSCGAVLDMEGRQCAALHGYWPEEEYGHLLALLGYWYNRAKIAVEANEHGHSVLNTLMNREHYPRLYKHRDYDNRGQGRPKMGWQTNGKTRPILLSELKEAVHQNLMEINHQDFLGECFTFMDNGKGKFEARSGTHDDTVMAWGIAWQARKRGAVGVSVRSLGEELPKPEEKKEKPLDGEEIVALES
jgi:hypothetical protein